jgi:hypothetical protein
VLTIRVQNTKKSINEQAEVLAGTVLRTTPFGELFESLKLDENVLLLMHDKRRLVTPVTAEIISIFNENDQFNLQVQCPQV